MAWWSWPFLDTGVVPFISRTSHFCSSLACSCWWTFRKQSDRFVPNSTGGRRLAGRKSNSNLRIVWWGTDLVGITAKIFFLSRFSGLLSFPFSFPMLSPGKFRNQGLQCSHIFYDHGWLTLATDELEGLATSSKKRFCCLSFTKIPIEYLKTELTDLDFFFHILKCALFLTFWVLRWSWQ